MTQWHGKSKKKPTGGFRNSVNRANKRLYIRGSDPTNTILGIEQKKFVRVRGGTQKNRLQKTSKAVVTNQKTKKSHHADIISEIANNANKQFVRRNILTKGGIIKIKIEGKEQFARITSRPGQIGEIQAILVEEPLIKEKAISKTAKKTTPHKTKKESIASITAKDSKNASLSREKTA